MSENNQEFGEKIKWFKALRLLNIKRLFERVQAMLHYVSAFNVDRGIFVVNFVAGNQSIHLHNISLKWGGQIFT